MENVMDYLQTLGANTRTRSVSPTRKTLSAIRRTVKSDEQLQRTEYRIEASKPVNILSDEFMNGSMKVSAKFAAPAEHSGFLGRIAVPTVKPPQPPASPNRAHTTVIMPEDNQARKTALIDSDAMRVSCPFEVVRYSEASFAVFGETKKFKDDLQSLGGKFNNWLKRDGKPTPGYIFPNWRKEIVLRYMERF